MLALPTLGAAQEKSNFDAELKSLTEAYQQAEQKFYEPYRQAKTDAEREKVQIDFAKHPAREFQSKFLALAQKAKGTDAGARALLWVMRLSQRGGKEEMAKDAVDQMMASYVESPVMAEFVGELRYMGWFIGAARCQSNLRKIAEKSPHRNVKAAAVFTLACVLMEGRSGSETEKAEARKMFDTLKKGYADSPYAKQADSYVFELEHLQIGMVAPDFEATDQEGKPFKLSDYRGKVVVLDFWGFW
jgi:hypothetical protein